MTKSHTAKTKMTAGLSRIIERRNYLAVAATGRRWVTPAFIIQGKAPNKDTPASDLPCVGFTTSKKVGNAVMRNRARRRLKEVARTVINDVGVAGWHYVIIARRAAVDSPFERLIADMRWALKKLHDGVDLKSKKGGQ